MAGEITRKRFSFSGYVQGVQGRIEAIEQVLDTIECGLYIQIAGMDVHTIPPQDGERGFAVKDDGW